jgi:3-dehydroquinate synthase
VTHVINVPTASPYDVHVGSGLAESIAQSMPEGAQRVLIVHTAVLAREVEVMRQRIADTGRTVVLAEIPDAEAGKTAEVLAFCWQVMGKSDFGRADVVVGFGGGAVTDLAGFVAASWMRGVALVQVPTTLQAMVDAAVGGKTGINTSEGKNLVGAFYEPLSVWCDMDYLLTQPRNDLVAGLAEVVKGGFIADTQILEIVESNMQLLAAHAGAGLLEPDAMPVVEELIRRKIQVKADVVASDLRESHLREILNYGHTLGHAIEYVERFAWRHGAAVSVGMVFAAELSRLVGKLSDDEVARHRSILTGLGLPVSYSPGRWDALLTAMRRDKKTRGATLRFVILQGIGNPVRLEGPDPGLLVAAYDAISAP